MSKDRVQILYIAGWSRSGATVLGQLLGQIEGATCIGELQYVWERGAGQNRLCSCGEPFDTCQHWAKVLENAYGGIGQIDVKGLRRLHATMLRTRNVMFGPERLNQLLQSADGRYYVNVTERLYRTLAEMSGSRVLIDLSKNPSYAMLLQAIPGFDVHVLHLVRDPRASAYSYWKPAKASPDKGPGGAMKRIHPAAATVKWVIWNRLVCKYWKQAPDRYMLVRYEDMVKDVEGTLKSIVRSPLWGVPAEDVVLRPVLNFGGEHTVAGNPVRFQAGEVKIKEDVEWKRSMPWMHRSLVNAIAGPWMSGLGYSVF